MTTTAEAVERHLETDVALVDTLARDLARLRPTARWLIEEYGWEDRSEESVVSALRRYIEDHPIPPLTRDGELLMATEVDVRTGLALVTIARTEATHRRIPKVWSALENLDTIAIVPGAKRIRLLVDSQRIDTVREVLPQGRIESVHQPISALEMRLPEKHEAASLIGHATSALTHKSVEVLDVLSCRPEVFVLVPDGDTVQGFEVLGRLTRQPDCLPTEEEEE